MSVLLSVLADCSNCLFIFGHGDQKFPSRIVSLDSGFDALAHQHEAPIHSLAARASRNWRLLRFQWWFNVHFCLVYRRSERLSLLLGLLLMLRLLHGTNFAVHLCQVSCRAGPLGGGSE